MNTNSNVYTIIYTTIVVVIVAAVLALASQALKPMQNANIQAETISQMLAAAQFDTKENLAKLNNNQILAKYSENIKEAYTIDAEGNKVRDLSTDVKKIELADNLKAANRNVIAGKSVELPVYVFEKEGQQINVIPVYGAGLWGPVWGYFAFDADMVRIIGAYFDHEGETPGLGAKIKDEVWFREQFVGEKMNIESEEAPFSIVKGIVDKDNKDDSAVDAITGATMTCKGLDKAIVTWINAYKPFFRIKNGASAKESSCCGECCGECSGECSGDSRSCGNHCKEGACTEGHNAEGKCAGKCQHHK